MHRLAGATNLQNPGIPVENHNFSTFSTGFSTRVFHRSPRLWICISVNISVFDDFLLFPIFPSVKILPEGENV